MTREILFRGKRKDDKGWVTGDLRHGGYYNGDREICIMSLNSSIIINHPVYPETVGQFTGKTHESGVKIFEGDILEYWDTFAGAQRFVVAWDDSAAAWTMQWKEGGCTRSIYLEPLLNGMKLIGNIHDNPELLNGTES